MSDRIAHETTRKAYEMQARRHKPGKKPRILAVGEIAFTSVYSIADGIPARELPFILEEWDAQHKIWLSAPRQPSTLKGAQFYTATWPARYQIVSAKFPERDTSRSKLDCLTVKQFRGR